jgi:hypothetical protein
MVPQYNNRHIKAALDWAAKIRNIEVQIIAEWKYRCFPQVILCNIDDEINTHNIIKEKSLGLEYVDMGTLTPKALETADSIE